MLDASSLIFFVFKIVENNRIVLNDNLIGYSINKIGLDRELILHYKKSEGVKSFIKLLKLARKEKNFMRFQLDDESVQLIFSIPDLLYPTVDSYSVAPLLFKNKNYFHDMWNFIKQKPERFNKNRSGLFYSFFLCCICITLFSKYFLDYNADLPPILFLNGFILISLDVS